MGQRKRWYQGERGSRSRLLVTLLLVAGVLLFATPTGAGFNVREVAEDELRHVQEQFEVPPFVLSLLDRFDTGGNTVIASQPVPYVVVLWDHYWREDQLRKIMAHELGHVLLADRGLPQSEARADLFAACFGSRQAQEYARKWGRPEGSCADLARDLGRKETAAQN